MRLLKPFVQSPDFALYVHACARFGINPCRALRISHEVDEMAFLLACAQALQAEEERIVLEQTKLASELTARRTYDYLVRFWDGEAVPPLESLFSDAPGAKMPNREYVRDGIKYAMIDGEEFQVLE